MLNHIMFDIQSFAISSKSVPSFIIVAVKHMAT